MASILYSPRNSQAAYFLLTSLLIYSLYLSWSSTGALCAHHLCAMSWSSTGALCAHLVALALLRMLRSFNQTGMENILYRTQSENYLVLRCGSGFSDFKDAKKKTFSAYFFLLLTRMHIIFSLKNYSSLLNTL